MSSEPDLMLTETEVRQVLDRAARLEAGRGSLSVSELEKVAEEAGFSRGSITRAIDEVLAARTPAVSSDSTPASGAKESTTHGPVRKASKWVRALAAVAVGGAAAVAASMFGPFGAFFRLASVLLVGGLLARALHHRRDGDVRSFLYEVAGTWLGFGIVSSRIAAPIVAVPMYVMFVGSFMTIGVLWLASAAVGALIIQSRRHPSGNAPVSPAGHNA